MSPTAVVTEEIVDFCLTRGGTLLDELAVNGSYYLNGEAFGKQAVTYMLVELPMHFLPQYADDFWYELRLKGVAPILAHPERYPELMAHTERLLLRNHLVDFICSDAHRAVGRDTDMRAGASVIREIAGEEEFKRISEENPMRVIHGEAIEVVKPEKLESEKKKGFWSRLSF